MAEAIAALKMGPRGADVHPVTGNGSEPQEGRDRACVALLFPCVILVHFFSFVLFSIVTLIAIENVSQR